MEVTRNRRGAGLVLLAVLGVGASLTGCGAAADSSVRPNAVDIGFAQDMSVHHDQALLMSQLAISRGTPAVRDLALSILSSQAEEVGAMRGWLRVWNQPATNPTPMAWMGTGTSSAMPSMSGMSMPDMSGMPMPSDHAAPAVLMPGMATSDEMLALYRARGTAFDILFAKLMVAHHVGGIQMDQAAIDAHASELVTAVAQQEIAEQYSDLGLLRTLLAANGVKTS